MGLEKSNFHRPFPAFSPDRSFINIDSFLKETYRFPDLEILLNDYDIILSPKRHYPYNVATQYAISHLVNDLNLLKEVIQHLTPEYAEAFHTFMYHCNAYSGYNMFITRRKHFDEYSQWLFRVLFELEKRVKLSAYPDQARLFGYLSERLINVYCIRHRLKIKYVPVIMPLEETFQNPSNLLYTLRQLKNDLIYNLTELLVMPLVSVIIPIYNTEKFLPLCISSVLNQTLTDIEVLLVNDGSTDGSGKICDEYACKDQRIQVIHTLNQGVSHARNQGLETAKGEYIAFMDSDDWIETDMIATLYQLIRTNEAGLATC